MVGGLDLCSDWQMPWRKLRLNSEIELVEWLAIGMKEVIVGWLCALVGYGYGALMLACQEWTCECLVIGMQDAIVGSLALCSGWPLA